MKDFRDHAAVFLAIAILPCSTQAQELAPDDPSIAGDLGAWFRDAANTFAPETGIWADSSGNGNDAVPVGEVNVVSPLTFIAPVLSSVSGGAFSTEDVSSVRFANDADDLLISADLNLDAGLTDLTIFVVYHCDFLAANPNLTRVVGFGSISATQANPGDHFNLAGDPSIRKDNGQLGAGLYSEAFPDQTTFIRTARMSASAIDDWFNVDGTLNKVFSVSGSSYTTSSDDFFLGDVRCGFTSTPGFPAIARADFDIIESVVYTAALTDQQVAGVNEWLANHLGEAASGRPLEITAINVDSASGVVTISWASQTDGTYSVEVSEDLDQWEELEGGIDSDGEMTSYNDTESGIGVRRFYRVRQLSQTNS